MPLCPSPFSARAAHAEFPERTVKIVVPFDAGGTLDADARALAQKLNDKWNVPGDRREPARRRQHHRRGAVAKAAPDGYSLLFANTSVSTNPSLFKSLPYDTLRELAPVVYLVAIAQCFAGASPASASIR